MQEISVCQIFNMKVLGEVPWAPILMHDEFSFGYQKSTALHTGSNARPLVESGLQQSS